MAAAPLTVDNGSGNSFTSITINNGTVQVGNNDANGSLGSSAIADNGTLAFNRTDNLTVANVISGTGGLTENGSDVLTLGGANTYSGTTAINAGQLILANASAARNSTVNIGVVSNGLEFATGITAATVGGLAGNGNLTLTNLGGAAVTLTVGGPSAATYNGRLTGGSLTQTNTGSLTLTTNCSISSFAMGNDVTGGSVIG